ncbi:glycosyltransferase family 2 protein [Desulfobacter postgatei]|uniref:glycosyltransferase family 2 protein n=1 Tax=Desulfobacter postgatei TaxID=2293 RepID=UPI00259AF2D4|nr:glycosyltransferase family 2 protein [uncultured Desulfobacter sp.]
MDISVIIPTFNNSLMLSSTLSAFERVKLAKDTEFIVVDNNSTDDTPEIIRSFSDRLPIKYAFEPNQGVSAAKNRGLGMANGKVLIFTDDDVRPCAEWLMLYLDAYKQNPTGFFWGGPVISIFEGPVPDKRLLKFAPPSVKGLNLGDEEHILTDEEWFIGANWACTPDILSTVGLFNEAVGPYPGAPTPLVGEETELQRRIRAAGFKALYLPDALNHHVVPAKKCTLAHVADRAEASGRFSRITAQEARIPRWRYRKCVERWVKAWIKRIAGKDWYPDYISYRVDKGFILGAPKRPKE